MPAWTAFRFLLALAAQALLASAQEGGHHPRVPRSSLFALRVPEPIVAARRRLSKRVNAALDALYAAAHGWQSVVAGPRPP